MWICLFVFLFITALSLSLSLSLSISHSLIHSLILSVSLSVSLSLSQIISNSWKKCLANGGDYVEKSLFSWDIMLYPTVIMFFYSWNFRENKQETLKLITGKRDCFNSTVTQWVWKEYNMPTWKIKSSCHEQKSQTDEQHIQQLNLTCPLGHEQYNK